MEKTKKNETVHSSFWANFFRSPADQTDLQKSLKSIPLFNELNKKDLTHFLTIIHNRNYLAGEYIFYQGDPGIGLYIIRSGEIKIKRVDDDNNETLLAKLAEGDFFGELALIDGDKRSASAVAAADSRLAVIFKPDLDEFIERFPKKGIKVLQGIAHIIAHRLRKINEDYFSLQKKINTFSEDNYGA
jgi:CRP-like cAMP-binding protein